MSRISQKNYKSKKKSRRMKAWNTLRKKRRSRWQSLKKKKELTEEQKKIRVEKILESKKQKERLRQLEMDKKECKNIRSLNKALFSVLKPETLQNLAKATGFIKRSGGKITAFAFIYILSFGFFGNGAVALPYLVKDLQNYFKIFVTIQGLSKRINSKAGVVFLKETLKNLMATQLNVGASNKISKMLPMFSSIYLEDSTLISLNETLEPFFVGNGGGASKSAMKINFIYDIVNLCVLKIKITSGIVSDYANSLDILKFIKPGTLVIRDLGYFMISNLKKIECLKGFYLSRLSISTNIYLNKNDQEPLNIPTFLKKQLKKGKKFISIDVYVGNEERFKTRLVAEAVPKSVIAQREEKYEKKYKKKPSEHYIEWCNFSIFITNIPEDVFEEKIIINLYKIRWQIELIFKNFKSNIELDIIEGTNPQRVESLLYGRLITIVIIFMIHNYAASIAENREVSGDKLTKWLKNSKSLHLAIRKNNIKPLLIRLEFNINLVCKQELKRKTTFDELSEHLQTEKINQESKLYKFSA